MVALAVLLLGTALLAGLVRGGVSGLLDCLVYVYALLGYARTLLLAAVLTVLGSLILTFLAALLLRFLLRACALVERVEVYLAEHVDFRGELLFALKGEYLALFASCRSCVFLLRLRLCLLRFGCYGRLCLGGLVLHLTGSGLVRLGGYCPDNRLHSFNRLGGFLYGLCRCLCGNRFYLFGFVAYGRSLVGGSLGLSFGSSLGRRFLAQTVKVNLAQYGVFLRLCSLDGLLLLAVRRAFLLLGMLLEQLLGLVAHLLVRLELFLEGVILAVAELEAEVVPDLAKVTSLFQEFNCRLKSYIQFTNCFI